MGRDPASGNRSKTGLHPACPARRRSGGSRPWATAAGIVRLPQQVAGCFDDAEPGHSEDEIDVMAPILRR